MSIDLKITQDGDLDLFGNTLTLVTEQDYLEQKLAIVLRSFLGDWFLDLSAGIPYFEDILKKQFDPIRIESILKSSIVNVLGVNKITAFDLNLINPRELVVNFTVNTDFGELEISEPLT